jgi:ligand-binding SRPBCC domain-containing protein
MYSWTHTVVTAATPEQVWPLYADVRRWLEWDGGLEAVTLDGPFAVGSRGTLQVEGQPPLTWELTEVEENACFTDVTEIPGVATLTFRHRIQPQSGATSVTHEVTIVGPAAAQLGPMVTSDTPGAMDALVVLAEQS